MDINSLATMADMPYPDVNNIQGNKTDIKLLSKAFSSCGSETTAVLQYIFQHYVITDNEISNILGKIAQNEMKHHMLLGESIVKLGGVPYYTNGNLGDYSTQCVYEGLDIKEILNQNILDEKAAVEYYEYIKTKLSSDSLKELIDRIILDEIVHIDTFSKLLEYVTFYKEIK